MRTKTANRCISICNEVIINPKWRSRLSYVIEAMEQERTKNNLRNISIKSSKQEDLINESYDDRK